MIVKKSSGEYKPKFNILFIGTLQCLATLGRVLFELMDTNSSSASLEMSLDLLVARASLDMELRQQLLGNPEACCIANGVCLPEGTRVVFTTADTPLIIKEIPLTGEDSSSIERIELTDRQLATSGLNMATEATETNTTTVAEAEVDVGVGVSVVAVVAAVVT